MFIGTLSIYNILISKYSTVLIYFPIYIRNPVICGSIKNKVNETGAKEECREGGKKKIGEQREKGGEREIFTPCKEIEKGGREKRKEKREEGEKEKRRGRKKGEKREMGKGEREKVEKEKRVIER